MTHHANPAISLAGRERARRISTLLSYINLSPEAINMIRECQPNGNGNLVLTRIFPNGWLSVEGVFTSIGHREHEKSCKEVTGFGLSDQACEAGWIKISTGLPINHKGEVLLSHLAKKDKLTKEQIRWLNDWLNFIERNRKSMSHFTI
jgi:hypothetical protein